MSILVIQHHEIEKPGRIGETLMAYSHDLDVVKLYAGEELPTDYGDIDGLVVMGGPMNVDEVEEHPYLECEMALIKWMHQQDLPVLGVCLGAQLIAKALGGEVGPMHEAEVGFADVELTPIGRMETVLYGMPWRTKQFHTHGYEVTRLPAGAQLHASSEKCKHQMFSVGMRTWAFQYHFEWTKADMHSVVDKFEKWIRESGGSINQIRDDIDAHGELYRHLGDRMCERLVLLLFDAEARGERSRWQAANYNMWQ